MDKCSPEDVDCDTSGQDGDDVDDVFVRNGVRESADDERMDGTFDVAHCPAPNPICDALHSIASYH